MGRKMHFKSLLGMLFSFLTWYDTPNLGADIILIFEKGGNRRLNFSTCIIKNSVNIKYNH